MEYRNLGISGVKVSPICLGTAFRGAPPDDDCVRTIHHALDLGINFVDTANAYQNGHCEEIVGKALKGRRHEVVLTTKVCSPMGSGPNEGGLSRIHIMQAIENSLSRLQTDYVDLYLAHSVDANTPIDETLETFNDLVRQGKVRYFGCSNFPSWMVCKGLWVSDRGNLESFTCVQESYHLLDRRIEREQIPLCLTQGLGVMTYSATAVGLLTGRFRHGSPPPAGTVWTDRVQQFEDLMTPDADAVVVALKKIASNRDKTPAQVAINWILTRPGITAAIIGPDSEKHVDENMGGAGWSLSEDEIATLNEASTWAVSSGDIV